MNGGEEIPLGLFVACSDSAELLDLGEEVLDQVALFVDLCIELGATGGSSWMESRRLFLRPPAVR